VCVTLIAAALVAGGCAIPPASDSGSGGAQTDVPDRANLEARVAAYYQAAATGNGPAMWPYMLGSVAGGKEAAYYGSTSLPRGPAQVKIEKVESISVHSDYWGVKPDAMAAVTMQALDPQQNVWTKLTPSDTWYYMSGQWYLGKGM
jgi:hypothetical protein